MPVVPATQEAEAGESLELEKQSLQWAEIAPLHSSLGNTVRLHLKKKKLCTSLTGYVTLSQLVNQSESQFSQLQNGIDRKGMFWLR